LKTSITASSLFFVLSFTTAFAIILSSGFTSQIVTEEIPFSISLYYDENEVLINTEVKEANTNE